MDYYKNPITRYLLRKNILPRIKYRMRYYARLLTHDALDDIKFLLQDRNVEQILDVGANIGFMTYQFQRRFPKAQIHCFEPNPDIYRILVNNYQDQKLVKMNCLGIGGQNGELEFHLNANSGTSSFLIPTKYHQRHQARRLLEPIKVPVVKLDDYCRDNEVDHIDILKLDIEGYELNALQGSLRLLTDQSIDIIYTEVNLIRTYEQQPLFHEITVYLEEMNYYLFNVEGFWGSETPIRQALQSNATYISRTFRKYLERRFGIDNCGW